jgi:hypothetical protein
MLETLKRWFGSAPRPQAEGVDELSEWAQKRKHMAREVPGESGGVVVEGRMANEPFRLEWGPSKRSYVEGFELRLSAEVSFGGDLQLLVLNRPLQEAMERAVFEQYVDGVQTRIDNQTPPEMRWLVMFSKLPGSEMGPLRERYVALSSSKGWLVQWLEGSLTQALQSLRVDAEVPVVLMIGRGRLMLRTALAEPELPVLQSWLRLFETAMREARRVANDSPDSISPSTQPSLWPGSALPGDERKT